jgi:hypothetical protein
MRANAPLTLSFSPWEKGRKNALSPIEKRPHNSRKRFKDNPAGLIAQPAFLCALALTTQWSSSHLSEARLPCN